jgi:ABC-type branched-subunit amino acid transport system substrate-binding protein
LSWLTLSLRGAACALALTCAGAAWSGSKAANPDDPIATASLLAKTDRPAAAALLEDAITAGATPDLALRLHAAEQQRLLGAHPASEAWFKSILVRAAGGPEVEGARLGLLLLDAATDPEAVPAADLAAIPDDGPLDTQNADRYLLLAAASARADDAAAARAHTKSALTFAKSDEEVEVRVRASLAALASSDGEAPVEVVRAKLPPLDEAELALASGDLDRARSLAREALASSPPGTPDAAAATALTRRIDTGNVVHRDVVGVLLPLTGKFGAVGNNLKVALESGCADGGGCRKLVVVDSGDSAESAVRALESLVLEQGAVAVVGPVRTEDGPAVAAAAEAYRVPLVSMSRAMDLAVDRPWVFQATPTVADQAAGLVAYVMGKKAMKNFAIFAPDSDYGKSAAAAFRREVVAKGGQISAEVFYPADATDLVPYAKKLGSKDYEARKAELAKLQREAKDAGGDWTKVVLPPVLNYDALFLPDSSQRIPLACAGLAYEEFPIGDFQTRKDGPTIPLLGLASWNNKALSTAGGLYVRSSIFVDSWASGGSTGSGWAARHGAKTGREPSALEAEAYDTGRLIAAALGGDASTREAVRDALAQVAVAPEATATGAVGFTEARSVDRSWQVMSFNRSGLVWVTTVD